MRPDRSAFHSCFATFLPSLPTCTVHTHIVESRMRSGGEVRDEASVNRMFVGNKHVYTRLRHSMHTHTRCDGYYWPRWPRGAQTRISSVRSGKYWIAVVAVCAMVVSTCSGIGSWHTMLAAANRNEMENLFFLGKTARK